MLGTLHARQRPRTMTATWRRHANLVSAPFPTALITLLLAVGPATSALSQARTADASGAERPFARSRDRSRELYIIAFGLFGPESVFAREAEKAGQILRTRLQPDAQLRVRFNSKRGGNATSA